jgi:serine/threonine protein kinase
MRMAKDIALGMNWLHQNKPPIIHRDLKPANLLVTLTKHSLWISNRKSVEKQMIVWFFVKITTTIKHFRVSL